MKNKDFDDNILPKNFTAIMAKMIQSSFYRLTSKVTIKQFLELIKLFVIESKEQKWKI